MSDNVSYSAMPWDLTFESFAYGPAMDALEDGTEIILSYVEQ